jgi:leucyl aminopeptidase
MDVRATTQSPAATGADTIVVGAFEDEGLPPDLAGGALNELLDAGEAKRALGKVAVTHAGGVRWIVVGLGRREELTAERARIAAGAAIGRTRELAGRTVCWAAPQNVAAEIVAGLVDGTVLAAYDFDRYKSEPGDGGPKTLVVATTDDLRDVIADATTVAEAQNLARDLQNTPGNELTPSALAARARELAEELEGLSVEVGGREEIVAAGMGAFAAVAQGSEQEPALITLRYEGPGAGGEPIGFVGKAVTFDTGGISIKPAAKMQEMKFDMSGGAAVVEAIGAIARLGLAVRVVGVVGATENMPDGRAVKPGDIVRAMTGTTIEVNNTDAEGRLVLADCLAHARAQGATRLVDLATLTGAIVVALGSTYAGLFSNDDAWADELSEAARASGEELWRLPLHEEYADMMKGRYADLSNVNEARKASSSAAAEFLKRFVDDTPWAHVDIAGTAWDRGRSYAAKGGSGFGVRLLVELARRAAASPAVA